jgi:hypothetical protein
MVGGFRGGAVVVSGQGCAQISEDARWIDNKSCIGLDPLRRCGSVIVGAGAQFVGRSNIERARKLEEQQATFSSGSSRVQLSAKIL